jgi:hypothetical protein
MRKGETSQKAGLIKEGHLEFLLGIRESGVVLPQEDEDLLIRHGRVKPNLAKKPKSGAKDVHAHGVRNKSEFQREADKSVDVTEGDDPFADSSGRHIIQDDEAYDLLANSSLFTYQGGKKITKSDWYPADRIYHAKDFVNWINSINKGFQTMTKYKPFAMYCQQAQDWLDEDTSMEQFTTSQEREEYAYTEIEKCRENTLYFMDKYLYLKEGDMKGGQRKYLSKPVHKVMCFMVDCGYSIMMGKPRQIAATSTIGGIFVAKLVLNRNFFIKFVTQDKETGTEIFEDKIKFPFGELPEWFKPEVSNDRDNLFKLGRKTAKKGTKGGVNSKLQVVAPTKSAINGGSPQLVGVDEAGYIGILGSMIKQARPTMFMMNDDTGLLEFKRQMIVWGTGGEMDKGGKAYEIEFFNALAHWNEGKFNHGIIPIFFDWTTRPGMTKKKYNEEKDVYTVEGPDKEKTMVEFRQTYPTIIEDMFLTSHKLLVGIDWINKNKARIQKQEHKFRPVKGYFEPVYDTKSPTDENSDVPFKIIGATFVALDDLTDDMGRASVEILLPPQRGWKDRYYQGTDPISTDNGFSKMSSTVFDAYWNSPAAIVNYRSPDHKDTFLQCVLLGIYYDTRNVKTGVPELVEANIGTAYFDYKEAKGFYRSLVHRKELPEYLSGGGALLGIDNKANRKAMIVNKLHEVLTAYGDRIWFPIYFNQLRTFVCKVTESGVVTWGTPDSRKFQDDALDGLVFSYICSLSFIHREPKNMEIEGNSFRVEHELARDRNGNLVRRAKTIKN